MRVEIVQTSLDSVVSLQPLAAPGSWKVRCTMTILCRPANVNGLLHNQCGFAGLKNLGSCIVRILSSRLWTSRCSYTIVREALGSFIILCMHPGITGVC